MTSSIPSPRKKLARRAVRALVLACAALAASWPAFAQSPSDFASVLVKLWPEYDRQALLVIYDANLPATTTFPADLRIPLPEGVAEPYAVAQTGSDGNLVDLDYTTEQVNGHTQIDLQASSQVVRIEYYQDITIDGSQRSFTFTWPGGLSVASLTAQFQVPPGITNLNLTPAGAGQVIGVDGLTYQNLDLGTVGPGDRPTITARYQKAGNALTVDSLPQATALSQPQTTVGAAPEPSQLIAWGALGLAVVLLGVVAVLYFRVWRTPPRRAKVHPRRSRRDSKAEARPAGARPGNVYCHQCGELAEDTDLFCRHCGTKLRRS